MADESTDAESTEAIEAEEVDPSDDRVDSTSTADEVPNKKDDSKAKPAAPVARKKVVSKRVTPKGGATAHAKATPSATRSKKSHDDDEISFSSGRYTPPSHKVDMPSPWWVPALMFGLLILGSLLIIVNYMGVIGGEASNVWLIVGLGLILAGIIAATQYR
ncbi:MAG: cell division protein CrgA [Acidimicrobiales bacterium]|nr:cell division protein CrgA [Acidimicrobiales bacterium]MCB1247424.1 cell division protein CrgA [Acidimicrobiia bacterium]